MVEQMARVVPGGTQHTIIRDSDRVRVANLCSTCRLASIKCETILGIKRNGFIPATASTEELEQAPCVDRTRMVP